MERAFRFLLGPTRKGIHFHEEHYQDLICHLLNLKLCVMNLRESESRIVLDFLDEQLRRAPSIKVAKLHFNFNRH